MSHRNGWLVAAVVACCWLLAGCGDADRVVPRSPIDVVLITLDTTRADRLGCYGNDRIATPHLDSLAGEGVLFENALTPVPSTLPSHASILTGLYPARHGVHDNGVYRLDPRLTTLAERFHEAGYETAAFVSAFVLDRQFGLDQGFDAYDDRFDTPLIRVDPAAIAASESHTEDEKLWLVRQTLPFQRRAESVTRPAVEWLDGRSENPLFLWVHYFDPHMDYEAPAPWATRYDPDYDGALDGTREAFVAASRQGGWRTAADIPPDDFEHMVARYDGEVSYMDHWIGELLDALRRRQRWNDTLVVVIGDHGEGFGEHDQVWEHTGNLFDETVRVPFLVRLPGGRHADTRSAALARTIDVAPTVLDEAGLSPLEVAHGMSLIPLLDDAPGARGPEEILLETGRERQALASDRSWLGVRSSEFKLLLDLAPGDEIVGGGLYDLRSDPAETTSVVGGHPDLARRWTGLVFDRYHAMSAQSADSTWHPLDEHTAEALRSLGYID